ncbi:mitochondrial 50S ribosomal protein L16, putative [Pediculus humanus corporis]|uniref:Large ribosomal subunit protein uL16m n=1 Tax=Pediculus humanus subsp. corporis TaxID=121224 RepID=E0W0I2_PEDHC|nr:mitochondrial 50S ribosomal protein L16, putative [Pediculus humanus corporis]EEB19138.1 mitochondrial 50S ribosomal protein L16, putative [Pediculus humanus corporis]
MFKINSILFNQVFKSSILSETVKCNNFLLKQCANIHCFEPPKPVDSSDWPDNRKLRVVEKQPFFDTKPPKLPKMLRLLRGPEEVHTDLVYKQYGVKALLGGRMKHTNFEAVRRIIFKKLDTSRMFAFWRVEPPWQPMTKKGVGKRMGGGKGSAHHYATPVKAERIIIELGGNLDAHEARKILGPVAEILPFPARFVSQKYLDDEREKEKLIKENNTNKFTMEYVIKNNMGGCQKWLSPYDYKWFGKYK